MAAVSGGVRPAPAGNFESVANALLKTLFALACVAYALLAFDYFISFADGREGLWLRLFAALVSREHALGSGSVHVDQAQAYGAGLQFMLMHTTMGALALALGPFQFSRRLRQRYRGLHRNAGRVYLATVGLSMIAGLGYLATTPPGDVFSGAAFAIALVGLDVLVLLTAGLALHAILRRDVPRHRAWMAVNFGLLLSTPVLRLLWVVYGWVFPDVPQTATNLAIMTFLLPLCVGGMLLWLASQPDPRRLAVPVLSQAARHRWHWGGRLLVVLAAMMLGMAWLGRFVLPVDPWGAWLSPHQLSADGAAFARLWPLFVVYALSAMTALALGAAAVGDAIAHGRCPTRFALASITAALAGAALAQSIGDTIPGGWPMLSYWWSLAVLWPLTVLRGWSAARSGATRIARDWTLTAIALAWLPLTTLPQVPAWQRLAGLSASDAALVAVTLSYIAHLLAVQVVIDLYLDRRVARRAGGHARSLATD